MINKKTPKQLCITFTILLFSLCITTINAQGPNAPEAASFEPVDATDMVNLVTGDLSYVLPLLNIPSPEGGYPISLSYHAGIAGEQEASWVGLGWSLNPGAINRGVNGYPDDWGKTNVNEFFYDEGWTENYYSFGAGVTLGGGVNVGLGLSWGSNQSLGGYVSASIGLGGENGASIGGSIGTNGASLSVGGSGFNASVGTNGANIGYRQVSIGTNGVGIGYGMRIGSSSSIGVGLNYNYNSGLSGGVSISKYSTSLGINFSSNGVSVNASANGVGMGISFSNNGVSEGEYNVETSSGGFFIPGYIFYISYSHQHIKYSLYKYNNLYTSGILNPIAANKLKPYSNSSNLSRLLYENNFMDVNVFPKYNNSMDVDQLLNNLDQVDKNNLILPNYDNYSVSAQGLSGSLKPYIHSELNLSARGRGEQNEDDLYMGYLNHDLSEYNTPASSGINVNRDAIKKLNFTFDNAYSSFLRMERTNINEGFLQSLHSDHIMDAFVTNDAGNFNNDNSLTNTYEAKKREGNYIETFTNKEIRDSYSSGNTSTIFNFLDAREFNNLNAEIKLDRSDTNTFLDDGIGAYQITTSDGRTYHYSLPVYNYESFYKNFKDEDENGVEDENFFEIQKTKPYATHWLITAITGPDYIDNNNNGKVDENDYGYWVAFDYGKWSDGYTWRTPSEGYIVDENEEGDNRYSYAWGRKQIYYLDAIKTRTHTALFVKELRSDSKSKPSQIYNQKHLSGTFNINTYADIITSQEGIFNKSLFASPTDQFYNDTGDLVTLPSIATAEGNGAVWQMNVDYYRGNKSTIKYFDAEENSTLRLMKIILLDNKSTSLIDKTRGNITNTIKGYYHFNTGYTNINICNHEAAGGHEACANLNNSNLQDLYNNPIELKEFDIHQHQNVLDIYDIDGLDIENKAQQIIEFTHDYTLAQNTSNSQAIGNGRLTLKEVSSKGKQGIELVPPYKFSYQSPSTTYNKDYIDDWGYHFAPHVWSLNEIQTPTGGKIKISYEKDSYYAEAASYESKYFEDISVSKTGNTVEITFNDNSVLTDFFKIGRTTFFSFTKSQINDYWDDCTEVDYLSPVEFNTPLMITNITGNKLILQTTDDTEGLDDNISFTTQTNCLCNSYLSCYSNLKIKNNRHPLYTDSDLNGKEGGGIRTQRITINNGVKDIARSEYVYTNPNTGKISGITSYAPSDDPRGIPYVSELPPPMVTYGHVKMINKDGNGNELGSTAYEFGTLEPFYAINGVIFSLGEAFKVEENQNEAFQNGSVMANKYTLHNSLGNIGRMLSIKSYNTKGQLLNKSINNYKTSLDTDGEIGVTQESHKSYKRINKDGVESFAVSSTSKINYPSVLESVTTTQSGFTSTRTFNKHDFLTGQVLETTTKNSKGNEFKTELIPAYSVLEYSGEEDLNNDNLSDGYGMGSKVDINTNKNMLTQEAMTKTYLKVGTEWKETGVGITTWNNDWTYTDYKGDLSSPAQGDEEQKIWRKHKSFIWNGSLNDDGTLDGFTNAEPAQDDENFVWTVGPNISQTNSEWKNISTTTQYDHFSMPLEVKDINNNYASTKMCDNNSKILTVSNAAYTEMYYSGAEYFADDSETYFDGQVKSPSSRSSIVSDAHTGQYVVNVDVNQNAFEVQLPQNLNRIGTKAKFKISVWVRNGQQNNVGIKINNGTSIPFSTNEEVQTDNWVLLNDYITIPTSSTNIAITSTSGTIELDDFRLHPIASSMTSYVYNEWDELWYIIGNSGLASMFEYDSQGRLEFSYTEVEDFDNGVTSVGTGGFKKVSENEYSYQEEQ